jgi:hypothetical protein
MKRNVPKISPKLAFALLAAGLVGGLVVAGCDGDSPSSPRSNGRLSVLLTDAPTDEVSAVHVFVVGLTIKPVDGPVERIADELGGFDLLALQGTTAELVELGVDGGQYEFVQIDLDQDRSSVVEIASGSTRPLQIASEEVKVLGGFTVPPGGETTVTLDFDAAASLRKLGNGEWLLTPVITLADASDG